MADFCNYTNTLQTNVEPYVLVDTVSSGTTYVGTSSSFSKEDAAIWKIKKQCTDGTVSKIGFPGGCQDFKFMWCCRASYTYC